MIGPVTFVVFLSSGKKLSYAGLMEAVMLLGKAQGPLHHLNHIQEQIASLTIETRKIQEFLDQPEPVVDEKHKKAKPSHPDYAIHIENQNFTWGVQTVDIDDMFDNMWMQMRGETRESQDAKKTKVQLIEDHKKRQDKLKDLAQGRKMEKVVCLKDITVKIPKG